MESCVPMREPLALSGLDFAGASFRFQSNFSSSGNPDQLPEEVALITLGSKSALKYDLSEQNALTSYFSPSYLPLTSPLLFDKSSNSSCVVLGSNRLLIWDGVEGKLEKVPQIEVATKKLTGRFPLR